MTSAPPTACPSTAPGARWARPDWQGRRTAHLARVQERADAFVSRRSRGATHPVDDFLFTYYSFSPAKLKQWLPPLGTVIEAVEGDRPMLGPLLQITKDGQAQHNPHNVPDSTRNLAKWVVTLCSKIRERPPRFRCFGLHEWAMVYRQSAEQIRHQGYALRLPAPELARFVESQVICCSHYDAFRFFTPEARPLNVLQPVIETRLDMEQAGCLHANMDLYKWACKLWPWVGSDVAGRAFELAVEARELDMRASPYDLRHLGCEPVRIETEEGREEYETAQRSLTARSEPIRALLAELAENVAGAATR